MTRNEKLRKLNELNAIYGPLLEAHAQKDRDQLDALGLCHDCCGARGSEHATVFYFCSTCDGTGRLPGRTDPLPEGWDVPLPYPAEMEDLEEQILALEADILSDSKIHLL